MGIESNEIKSTDIRAILFELKLPQGWYIHHADYYDDDKEVHVQITKKIGKTK